MREVSQVQDPFDQGDELDRPRGELARSGKLEEVFQDVIEPADLVADQPQRLQQRGAQPLRLQYGVRGDRGEAPVAKQFDEVFVDRRAGRLHDKDIRAPHVLFDLNVVFAVGETVERDVPRFHAKQRADIIGERRVGPAGKYLERTVQAP